MSIFGIYRSLSSYISQIFIACAYFKADFQAIFWSISDIQQIINTFISHLLDNNETSL